MLSFLQKNTDLILPRPLPMPRTTLCLLLGAMLNGPAMAALSDTVHPFVSVGYSYDDNLLRLPDDVPGFAGPRGDRITQTVVGASVERPFGRQLLTAQAKVSRVSFDHYDELNYNGKDFLADLEWHIANHWSGHVGGTYSESLTPFNDLHTSDRNLRTKRRSYADASWRFHPSWQLRASVSRDKYAYDLPSQRINDRSEDTQEAGIDYLATSSSRIGLLARHIKGTYPNSRVFGTILLDDGYSQDELKANINWALTATTRVQVLAGWARREHTAFSARDSSGANGRVNAVWQSTERLSFTAATWREFMAVESNFVSNSLNQGESLDASWQYSSKIKLDGQLKHEKRNFNELSGVIFNGSASDRTRSASAGLTYAPTSTVQIGANLFREQRTGSPLAGTGSYRANGASINITAQF